MREEHFVDLKGKRHVLYGGLLAMAHEQGLDSIDEEVLQIPSEENGNVAIVRAVVGTHEGKRFVGIGDASPRNVSRNIAPHSLRMASTRAKARALRDMCNIGITSLEETGGEDTIESGSDAVHEARRVRDEQPERTTERIKGGATSKQLNYLEALIADAVDGGVPKFEESAGKPLSELTAREASDWIHRLSGRSA